MKKIKTIIIVILITLATAFIKFGFNFPSADSSIIGVILSISSILFGLLVGFFITELWSRYTEIRSLQGERAANGRLMIRLASYFFSKNKLFARQFKIQMEKTAVADEIILWDEGHLEEKYYLGVADSFKLIKINNSKDTIYLDKIFDYLNSYIQTTSKMNILYKERLFFHEWFLLWILSLTIAISVLFLETSNLLYKGTLLSFPAIIYLSLVIIYGLDRLQWGRELITLEPNQVIFDELGVKRFYRHDNKKYISFSKNDYRTEKSLKGELKVIYKSLRIPQLFKAGDE